MKLEGEMMVLDPLGSPPGTVENVMATQEQKTTRTSEADPRHYSPILFVTLIDAQ